MAEILWRERTCELGAHPREGAPPEVRLRPILRVAERPHDLNKLKGWLLEYGRTEILDFLVAGRSGYLRGFEERFDAEGSPGYRCLGVLISRLRGSPILLEGNGAQWLKNLCALYSLLFAVDEVILKAHAEGIPIDSEDLTRVVIGLSLRVAGKLDALTRGYENKEHRRCPTCPHAEPGSSDDSWGEHISPVRYYVRACNTFSVKRDRASHRNVESLWRIDDLSKPLRTWRPLILVVDDERDVCTLIRDVLESHGYSVHTEHDGENGLQAAYAFRPALILLNNLMPRRCGLEVCRILCSDPATRGLRIVIHSACRDIAEEAFEAGASDFINTPFSPKTLLSVVEKVLAANDAMEKKP